MKIKAEVITIKPDIKDYKRIARELYPIKPSYVHKDKKRFNKTDRQKAKQELRKYY